MTMRYVLGIMLMVLGLEQGALAAPRVPASPQEVVAILPERPFAAAVPGAALSLSDSLQQAEQLLALAHQSGDPRYLGYAEAQLSHWLTQPAVPDEALLMRARIRQFNHQFGAAMIDLAQVLQHQPGHPEALLLQSSIYLVRADYALARQSCQRLRNFSTLSLALICEAQVDAVNGHGPQAETTMTRLLPLVASLEPGQQSWFYLALGDLYVRQNKLAQAENYYRRLDTNSPAALTALADVLLQQKRYPEVRKLLLNSQQHDGLLLRLALAEQAMNTAQAKVLTQTLAQRFAALRLRGDNSHLREEAMFSFYLQHDAAKALRLASANWQQQREPQDAEIYWQVARASGSASDLAILQQWLKQSGLQDQQLTPVYGAKT
jgi:tetratricopeptide (TPR) repeat protein